MTVIRRGRSAVKAWPDRIGRENRFADRSKHKKPDEVAAAVELALLEATPKRRYMVVPEQITIRKQIEQLVQLNEGQPYTYDRDSLVRMLDEALAQARPRRPGRSNESNKTAAETRRRWDRHRRLIACLAAPPALLGVRSSHHFLVPFPALFLRKAAVAVPVHLGEHALRA